MPSRIFFTTLLRFNKLSGGNMKMKLKLVALAVSTGVALPGVANAVQVAGDALDIYGKAHVSLDSVSGFDPVSTEKASNFGLSSNSSRLGFKGQGAVGSMTGFYKIESSVSFESGDASTFVHRAAYAGLKGRAGSFLVGYRDTPYKDVRGMFDVFGDTVGDARNVVGSVGNNGNSIFDVRAQNAIMYTTPKTGGFEANIMYSTSWKGDATRQAGQDNNNGSLTSVNLKYKAGSLTVAAAYEQQNNVDAATGDTANKGTGTRLVAAYDMGTMRIGLIFENLDNDVNKALKRSAYGANVLFKTGDGKIKLQYVKAGDNDAVSSSGANEVAAGYDYKLDKNSSTYIMYSKVSNETNAQYIIGNGHDQKYLTTAGQDVSAVSVGYTYSF